MSAGLANLRARHRVVEAINAARMVELRRMVNEGADLYRVMDAFGVMTKDGVAQWCKAHGLIAELAVLRANTPRGADRRTAGRLEDMQWMIDTGADASEAASRFGITLDGLEVWCRRNGLHAELAALRSRQTLTPTAEHAQVAARARWAA